MAEERNKKNWLNGLLDSCQQELEGRSVPCERSCANELGFEIKGVHFALSFEAHDDEFLKLSVVIDGTKFPYGRKRLLEAINSANFDTKVAKVYIDRLGDLNFNAELYINLAMDFNRILKRHIKAVLACIRDVKSKLE